MRILGKETFWLCSDYLFLFLHFSIQNRPSNSQIKFCSKFHIVWALIWNRKNSIERSKTGNSQPNENKFMGVPKTSVKSNPHFVPKVFFLHTEITHTYLESGEDGKRKKMEKLRSIFFTSLITHLDDIKANIIGPTQKLANISWHAKPSTATDTTKKIRRTMESIHRDKNVAMEYRRKSSFVLWLYYEM